MTWTHFHDMHSGGGQKLEWGHIFIEAPEDEAVRVFYNRFGRSPHRVTCTCCGEDYSLSEHPSLEQATAFQRGCDYAYFRPDGTECPEDEAWKMGKGTTPGYEGRYVERPTTKYRFGREHQSLDDYLKSGEPKAVYASEIQPGERKGSVPDEGYVWVGDDD